MIYTVNSSKNCVEVALFRAYIRRKPSGLLLVTVLSTLLPRPVFRTYPREIGEAVAVGRATSHALVVVLKSEHARVKLGVNHPMMPPHADHQREDEHDCERPKRRGKVEEKFQHSSPHDVQHARQHSAVSSAEKAGVDGYAVKQHLRLRVVWQGLLS